MISIVKQTIDSLATYSALSDNSKNELAACGQLLEFPKHHILVKEGQLSDKLFFIINGSARSFYIRDGKEITDWFAFENNFICALHSFFNHLPSTCFIELTERTNLLCFSRNAINNLSDKHHDIERLLKVIAVKTMFKLQRRVVTMQFENAHQRYKNLVLNNPDIVNRISLGHIASYLGITQETLSRIRAVKV